MEADLVHARRLPYRMEQRTTLLSFSRTPWCKSGSGNRMQGGLSSLQTVYRIPSHPLFSLHLPPVTPFHPQCVMCRFVRAPTFPLRMLVIRQCQHWPSTVQLTLFCSCVIAVQGVPQAIEWALSHLGDETPPHHTSGFGSNQGKATSPPSSEEEEDPGLVVEVRT
jgi:hypothetical protein